MIPSFPEQLLGFFSFCFFLSSSHIHPTCLSVLWHTSPLQYHLLHVPLLHKSLAHTDTYVLQEHTTRRQRTTRAVPSDSCSRALATYNLEPVPLFCIPRSSSGCLLRLFDCSAHSAIAATYADGALSRGRLLLLVLTSVFARKPHTPTRSSSARA